MRKEKLPPYDERLDIELQVINQMGFPGYFLIVMEFIQWSKDNGVPVGPKPWFRCGLAGGLRAENYRPRPAGI